MSRNNKKILGPILIVIGIILLGRTFHLFYFDFGDLFRALIPLSIIFIGIWLILRRKKMEDRINVEVNIDGQSVHASYTDSSGTTSQASFAESAQTAKPAPRFDEQPKATQDPKVDGTGRAKYEKFLGDLSIDLNGVNLHNVEVSMFIGDIDINLGGGVLQDSLNRLIISSFIGDIRIFVPKDMAVYCNNSNFIGDIEALGRRTSGFGNKIEAQTVNYSTASRKLYIAANGFIGDMKVFQV